MLRSLVLYELMALDGVAEAPPNWMVDPDADVFANLKRVISTQTDVLLGRGSYDDWSPYWPGSDLQPFADFINSTPKHVFTSTTPSTTWEGSTFVREDPQTYVRRLQESEGGDIGVHGSVRLASSLLAADLVDELRLVVSPVLAGSGRRLWPEGGSRVPFELVDVDRTASGATLLHLVRATRRD